jgi:hypothetical protein
MVLVAWTTLASAAVVAVSGPATAVLAVLAIGLVAVTTLFFSIRVGAGVAGASLLAYALAVVVGPVPPWSLGGDDLPRLLRSFVRWQTLGPDLLAAVALAGTAACAELASTGLEWDVLLRGAMGRRRPVEDMEPAGSGPEGARNGVGSRPGGARQPARQQEEQ